MTLKEACLRLGLKGNALRRLIESGELRATRSGAGQFAHWNVELPETGPPAGDSSPDLAAGDPVVPQVDSIEALDHWSTEALQSARLQWLKPDNPNGPITNAPCIGSGSMPSPENYAKWLRANDIIFQREAKDRPLPPPARGRYASLRPMVDPSCARHNSAVSELRKA